MTSSAINASKNVPPQYKDLYDALDEVREAAAEQVNLSRLQLAQRGLESETPVIRIAGMLSCYGESCTAGSKDGVDFFFVSYSSARS